MKTSHSASATVMKSLLRLSDAMDDSTKAKYKRSSNLQLSQIQVINKMII